MWPWAHTTTINEYIRYMNFPRTWHQNIRYRKHRRKSFTCQSSHEAFRIWRYASSTNTDNCSTFEKKKSPSDYTYDGYGDNACVCVRAAYEMLVLNGYVKHNAIFTKPTFGSKFQSFDCTKKKKLNASNVTFYNLWNSRCEIFKNDW